MYFSKVIIEDAARRTIMDKFPKTGKFMAVYKMKDAEPSDMKSGTWYAQDNNNKVIMHEADQYCWVDGELYEAVGDSHWVKTDIDSEVDFLADEAIESSLVFLTMGQPDVYVEKTETVLRGY